MANRLGYEVYCVAWALLTSQIGRIDPLMGTLKPQSNGQLYYSNTVIGTLAVDGWAVTFGTMRRGLGGLYQLHIFRCGTIIPGAH